MQHATARLLQVESIYPPPLVPLLLSPFLCAEDVMSRHNAACLDTSGVDVLKIENMYSKDKQDNVGKQKIWQDV